MKNRWFLISFLIVVLLGLALLPGGGSVEAAFFSAQPERMAVRINEVMPENFGGITDEHGDCEDWIELYNPGDEAVSLKGWGLSDKPDKPMLWTFPDVIIEPHAYLVVFASGKNLTVSDPLHTSFKLDNKGETVVLTNPQGVVVDSVHFERIPVDASFGLNADETRMVAFQFGSPNSANRSDVLALSPFEWRVSAPEFSHGSGFYEEGFDLALTVREEGAVIRYTLDGSDPRPDSPVYTTPIKIASRAGEDNQYASIGGISIYDDPVRQEVFKATVVRAQAYDAEGEAGPVVTNTYFVDKDMASRYQLPVISLVTDPENLFDAETGIYVKGKVFEEWKKNNPSTPPDGASPANYNQRGRQWERPATLQFFEADGTLGFTQNVGIRTSGGWTRSNRQKSLRIIARDQYDDKSTLDYPLFPGLVKRGNPDFKLETFKSVLFRSSGNDWEFTVLRDAFMESLVSHLGLDQQAYRPAVMFVDGEFWGIHNIRETFDADYLENHYALAPSDSVILEGRSYELGMGVYHGQQGDEQPFRDMIDFVREQDMSLAENYAYIKTLMDVDNFIHYSVAQIFFDNTDWPGNNIKVWRKRTDGFEPSAPAGQDGRWRWMLYDTDFGFGLYSGGRSYNHDTLAFATTPNGEPWPNPDWSTVLLRRLLTNEEFKTGFIMAFADLLNSRFTTDFLSKRLDEMSAVIEPAMAEHVKRWKINGGSVTQWKNRLDEMMLFGYSRAAAVSGHIAKYFDIKKRPRINLAISDPLGGTIQVNTITPDLSTGKWSGLYFAGIPIEMTAIPHEGYVFSGWEGEVADPSAARLSMVPEVNIDLKAVFVKK